MHKRFTSLHVFRRQTHGTCFCDSFTAPFSNLLTAVSQARDSQFSTIDGSPWKFETLTRRRRFSVFWTLTVWEDETSMRNYMRSGAHREAMPKLAEWCDEASTVHWHQESTESPNWEEATQRMIAEGRLAPVKHPSENHAAGIILE